MTIELLRQFFGYCLAMNVVVMLISTIFLVLGRNWASQVHAKMFSLDAAEIRQAYFNYLANYKIAVIVFNLVPWVALQLMGS